MVLRRLAAMLAVPLAVGLSAPLAGGSAQGIPAATTAPAAVTATPADRVGAFQVKCRWSHAASDDPIVFPGEPGAAHRHEFFGNTSTNAHSTTRRLTQAGTTCARPADKAAYWTPAVYENGVRLRPKVMNAYYRTGPLRDPSQIRPFPLGLRVIAGSPHAATPQSPAVTHWSCEGDGATGTSQLPESCGGGLLRLRFIFPNCWDGERLDAPDHQSHLAYSYRNERECPQTHPVALPTLKLGLRFDVANPRDDISLSSGGQFSAHADFWNAWEPAAQRELVERCLHGAQTCDSPVLPPRP